MIHISTRVKLPFLWGRAAFTKNYWTQVNLIVGPNGTGKTLLAGELAKQFRAAGKSVSFLQAERIAREDVFPVLAENAGIRSKIESVLSAMFGKSIRFENQPGGKLVPIVINKVRNAEYNLKDGECHGLKEIIILLTALYNTDCDCLIFDEPELHLHPQLQLFLINEIRKTITASPHRMCVLITHSPFFIDLRTPEDLTGVVVCHINRHPTHIDRLDRADEMLFRRFLPRFNTYHKQFFFSDNQIFVEGYTDQQIFSILLDCIEEQRGSAGTGIIDVGGKDELGVFFKVCSLLGTDGRIIGDLDSLFRGKLRDVLCGDPRPALWLEKQAEKQRSFYSQLFAAEGEQTGVSFEQLLNRLESYLLALGESVHTLCGTADYEDPAGTVPPEIAALSEKICLFHSGRENIEDLDTYKTVLLQAVTLYGGILESVLPAHLAQTIPLIRNLVSLLFAAAEAARVYILPFGSIEHYYTCNTVRYMPIAAKDRLFHTERDRMVSLSRQLLRTQYAELVSILEQACTRSV